MFERLNWTERRSLVEKGSPFFASIDQGPLPIRAPDQLDPLIAPFRSTQVLSRYHDSSIFMKNRVPVIRLDSSPDEPGVYIASGVWYTLYFAAKNIQMFSPLATPFLTALPGHSRLHLFTESPPFSPNDPIYWKRTAYAAINAFCIGDHPYFYSLFLTCSRSLRLLAAQALTICESRERESLFGQPLRRSPTNPGTNSFGNHSH